MKIYITLYGGISLYAAGVLDQPGEKALITELSAMNSGTWMPGNERAGM